MYPAAFEYHRPRSVEEAIRLLQGHAEARLLAGGHSLIPLMKQRLSEPSHVVDLRDVNELKGIRVGDGALVIGAMSSHSNIQRSAMVLEHCPVLAEVASVIGDPQVRNRGTIGGSLVHADPGADYPAIALAMDAELICVGPEGRRAVKAQSWFQGLLTSDVRVDEVLVEIRFPIPAAPWGSAYVKLPHPASRMALIGVAAALGFDGGGACARIGVGVTGVSSVPQRITALEPAVIGKALDEGVIGAAAQIVRRSVAVEPHRLSSAEQQQHLCAVLAERAIWTAGQRAHASQAAP